MASEEVKPKTSFKVMINGDAWTINFYTKASFEKKWKNCVGITEYEHKTPDLVINFKGPRVSRDTVAHELVHALLSYKDYTRLKPDTIEERFCEVMGKKYKILYLLTEEIYYKLQNENYAAKKYFNRVLD